MTQSKFKFGYRVLYYITLFGLFFEFFAYPVYAMATHFPYGMSSAYYIPFIRSDFKSLHNPDSLVFEELENTDTGKNKIQTNGRQEQIYVSHKAAVSKSNREELLEFFSEDSSGVIGYNNSGNSDDPSDNIFKLDIDKAQLSGKELQLRYEVYGIENTSGVARSINAHNATGGYFVQKNTNWKSVEETISINQLKQGENYVLFTAFENQKIDYKIKNVRITALPQENTQWISLADQGVLYVKDDKAYVKGNVSHSSAKLYINNQYVPVRNHEFETVLDNTADLNNLNLKLVKADGTILYQEDVLIQSVKEVSDFVSYMSPEILIPVRQAEDKTYGFALSDVDLAVTKEHYEKVDQITVQKLRNIDLAPLGTNIINVTNQRVGYRFLPDGAQFKEPAKLTLTYDAKLLPKGYDERDVKVLYFDMQQRRWLAVQTDTIIKEKQKIVALTDHFTDYIAGVIQAPESPETNSFTPTSISDIQVANPTANIMQIQPPTANQKGDGTLDFPITVPAGRGGLQPNLSVSYNNNGSSGIVGYGWDIAIPYISVDTKFGVPVYDSSRETESYLLNGEELLLKNGNDLYLPHRSSTTINRVSDAIFYPKVEGSFLKIVRKGNSPSNYYWEIWDKSGTKYVYSNTLKSDSGQIAKWYLSSVKDKNENYIFYFYKNKYYNSSDGNLNGAKEMNISRVIYNLHSTLSDQVYPYYQIDYTYKENINRPDATFNYRHGFKEANALWLDNIKVVSSSNRGDNPTPTHVSDFSINYRFNYNTNGKFGKVLLSSITTENIKYLTDSTSSETQSYTHTFDYYDDVVSGLFGAEQTIDLKEDFSDKHSVLSSSIEGYHSSEVNVGAGVSPSINLPAWWPFSFGGTINFSFPSSVSTQSSPSILFLDIDGDGLDDKVMKIGNEIKYRKNLGGIAFSDQLYKAHHIGDLGASEQTTQTDPEMSLSIIAVNLNASKSETNGRSRTFFADVNNDGLVDYVKDKIVYFNRIDSNSGLPTFTDNSELTPNLILKEGDVDPGISDPLPDFSVGNDLMDAVKVWVAPKKGTVNITGIITKNFVASHNGVRYSIEHGGDNIKPFYWDPNAPIIRFDPKIIRIPWDPNNIPILVGTPINHYNHQYLIDPTLLVTATQTTQANNVQVEAGDHIYFRVNSSQIPIELVDVTWDPTVTYVQTPGERYYSSTYSDAFLYGDSVAEPMVLSEPANYRIEWPSANLYQNYPMKIMIRAYKIDKNSSKYDRKEPVGMWQNVTIWDQTSTNIPGVSLNINGSTIVRDNPETFFYVEVEVSGMSGANWKSFDNSFIPELVNLSTGGRKHLIPKYDMRENYLTYYPHINLPVFTPIKLNNTFHLTGCQGEAECDDQYIYMTARYEDGQLMMTNTGRKAQIRYHINAEGDIMQTHYLEGDQLEVAGIVEEPFTEIMAEPGRKLNITYTTDDYSVASALNHYQNNNDLIIGSIYGFAAGAPGNNTLGSGGVVLNGAPPSGVIRANIATKTAEEHGLGTLYKDWGQFAYKGAAPDENFIPINTSFISRKALSGVSNLKKPSSQEVENGKELMELDPDGIDYDFEEGTFVIGSSPVKMNQNQVEAIKHFTILRSTRAMHAWSSHERLYVKAHEMSPYLRYNNQGVIQMLPIAVPTGVGQYGAVSIVKEHTSQSKTKGSSFSFYGFSIGTSESEANSTPLNDYMDLNGDGYPDVVGKDRIQVTSNRGGLTTNRYILKSVLPGTASTGNGDSAGGSSAHISQIANESGRFTGVRVGSNTTFANIGANKAGFTTNTRPTHVLIDLNGDGLADIVKPAGVTEFNTSKDFVLSSWNGYTEAQLSRTTSKSLGASIGAGMIFNGMGNSNLDLSVGFTGSNSVTQHVNDFVDFNGDGLPDYIHNNQIYFNAGTHHLSTAMNLPRLSESSSAAHGKTINGSILIPIPITIFGLGIIIKGGGGGGYSEGKNYNSDNVSLRDFDGDGYVDIIESTSETELKVRLSKIGRTNMLKMVHNPTGSKIELDYASHNKLSGTAFGPNYKMPFKKWVLSGVKVHDGFAGDGIDIQQFAFEYENGLKDRRERKFLGFGKVLTHQLNQAGEVYRSVEQEYLLNDIPKEHIYLPGNYSDSRKYQYIGNLLKTERTLDGMGRLLTKTEYEHAIYSIGVNSQSLYDTEFPISTITYGETNRILPLVKRSNTTVRHYQGNGINPYFDDVTRAFFKQYDQYGNVMLYRDETIPGEIVTVNIGYHYRNTPSQYLVNIPGSHQVNNNRRYSTTEIDQKGNIVSIKRYNYAGSSADVAETNLEYDTLGNLTKVTMPKPKSTSNDSERMFYTYSYDNLFKQFVTQVADAQGYISSTTYNHFGMPLKQTDLNGVEFTYTYDALRRVRQFKGPYNNDWTIENEYKQVPGSSLRYAVTKHNIADETLTPGVQILYTSSFADGLGRIVQTKKQLDMDHDCTTAGQGYRLAVSGQQIYDEFGRVVESYLGQEELECNGTLISGIEVYKALQHQPSEMTEILYDMRDRVVQSHVYGLNATTKYEYAFGNDGSSIPRSYEKIILPENNTSITYKDSKGRVVNTKQIDGAKELLTQYLYNDLNELYWVIDAESKMTYYYYDNFGQKIKTIHPDNGESEFTYDLTGKLVSSNNQELKNQNKDIKYNYVFNQLQEIQYPSHTVHYTYGAPGAPDHGAGRLIDIEDLTGTRTLKYGALGEVIQDERILESQSSGTLYFRQDFRYDSWGRIMEMTYPDGEKLLYQYNTVGQLKRITNTDGQEYLKDVYYNFFDQPLRIEYGNKVVTTNEYDITQRIRAMQLDRPNASTFMRNVYSYDRNQNIVNIRNDISQHPVLQLGGIYNKNYSYDGFNRLKEASGNWSGGINESHQYTLEMNYNDTHGIVNKKQVHNINSPAYNGQSENSYSAEYKYTDTNHAHAVSMIQYSGIAGSQNATSQFTYDANGNMIAYNTNFGSFSSREMIWDEQNRLLAVIDDGASISHYVYDHAGERTFKSIGNVTQVNIGGQPIYSVANFNDYLLYPSGYVVVDPGKDEYSKHYYINNKRFVSRLEQGTTSFVQPALSSVYSTNSYEASDAQTNGLDLNTALGVQNTIYNISVGNNEADCKQQLLDIIAAYTNINNTTSGSVAHCIIRIQEIMEEEDTFCKALVEVNKYICEPTKVNEPGDTTAPGYTQGEIDAFDCLTELNILVARYAAAVAQQATQQMRTFSGSYMYGCDNRYADFSCCQRYQYTGKWDCPECPELTLVDCAIVPVSDQTDEWRACIQDCLLTSNHPDYGSHCWQEFERTGKWMDDCFQLLVKCNHCSEFVGMIPPDEEEINCLRNCNIPGVGQCLEYYDAFGRWTKDCTNLIEECGCKDGGGPGPEPQPEIPIDRDMHDCALNCQYNGGSSIAYGCWEYFHITGEWMPGCKEAMRDCGCYDVDNEQDCYGKALNYIKNELILEPVNNACAVLHYVETHFKCMRKPVTETTPGTPGDLPDDWVDGGGTGSAPGADGPYDESKRKPIWWYHTDHLGSSTYLTDNFGRPSHYYETLPFGEMMVEHNQSANNPTNGGYNNAYKFNGKELDDATQMYYYGARYYDPRISIFVSVDPLAEQTMTPYQYVHNNPIRYIDPTGMAAIDGDDWYTNLGNGNIEWFDGSAKRDGYENIGSSASAVIGDEHYDLKDNGSFKNLDTGKEYFKGDSVKTKSGTEIKSNGTIFNSAQSFFRENKQGFLKDGQQLQNIGDDIMMFGAVLTVTGLATEGVGTAAGTLVYSFGNGISNAGLGLTITTELMSGNYSTKKGAWDAGWTIGGEVINYGINRVLPKTTSLKANEAVKNIFGNYFTRTKNYLEKKYEIR